MPEIDSYSRRFYDLPDGRLSAVHFGDASKSVDIVFINANGFNGLTYRALLAPLGVHSVAIDLRGHGMSELPADPARLRNWIVFRDDITHFINTYVDRPVVLAGHSFGAVSAIMATPRLSHNLNGFVGFDPVSLPLGPRLTAKFSWGRALMKRMVPIAKNAGKRRYIFDSLEAAFTRYQGRGAFKTIPDETLRDYLEGGLKPHSDGVQLACHPLWEQAIFVSQGANFYKAVSALPDNTHIIYGDKAAVSTVGTRRAVQRRLKGGMVAHHRDFHHMFPLQEQEFAIKVLRKALAAVPEGD